MDIATVRLELVRLTYRADLPPDETVSRATALEQYVTGSQPAGAGTQRTLSMPARDDNRPGGRQNR